MCQPIGVHNHLVPALMLLIPPKYREGLPGWDEAMGLSWSSGQSWCIYIPPFFRFNWSTPGMFFPHGFI